MCVRFTPVDTAVSVTTMYRRVLYRARSHAGLGAASVVLASHCGLSLGVMVSCARYMWTHVSVKLHPAVLTRVHRRSKICGCRYRHVLQARTCALLMKSYVWLLAIASSQALPVESGTKITPRRLASKVEPPKQQANTLHD